MAAERFGHVQVARSHPTLDALSFEQTLTSDDLLVYLRERLPSAGMPRMVLMDNAGMHTSKAAEVARPGLAKLGIYLYYLPAYSPELNRIEPVFKQAKHQQMPTRSFTSRADLRVTVQAGLYSAVNGSLGTVITNQCELARRSPSGQQSCQGRPLLGGQKSDERGERIGVGRLHRDLHRLWT